MIPKKKNTSSSGESLPKVTELRNEKEIVRAVSYTEEELATHLDPETSDTADSESKSLILRGLLGVVKNIGLGQTNYELSLSIDGLIHIITELDRAALDLVAGAEAQVAEFATELEKSQEKKLTLPTLSLAEITVEIRTFDQLLQHNVSSDPKITKMRRDQLGQKLQSLSKTVDGIVGAISDNDRKVEALLAYENAVKLVSEGLPEGIIGEEISLGK